MLLLIRHNSLCFFLISKIGCGIPSEKAGIWVSQGHLPVVTTVLIFHHIRFYVLLTDLALDFRLPTQRSIKNTVISKPVFHLQQSRNPVAIFIGDKQSYKPLQSTFSSQVKEVFLHCEKWRRDLAFSLDWMFDRIQQRLRCQCQAQYYFLILQTVTVHDRLCSCLTISYVNWGTFI